MVMFFVVVFESEWSFEVSEGCETEGIMNLYNCANGSYIFITGVGHSQVTVWTN